MDIIVLVILILGIIIGYRKGFIDGIFGLIGGILAIVLALVTYKPIANIVVPILGIDQTIYNYVVETMSNASNQSFTSMLDNFTGASVIINQATNDMAMSITNFITNMLVLGALFIIYTLIIIIIKNILNGIASLPVINLVNGVLGGALGFVKAGCLVLIAFAIIYFASMGGYAKGINDMIDNSYLSKNIYNNNVLVKVLCNQNLQVEIEEKIQQIEGGSTSENNEQNR